MPTYTFQMYLHPTTNRHYVIDFNSPAIGNYHARLLSEITERTEKPALLN